MEKENKYGTVTVGYGSHVEKEIPILDFVQSQYKDHRLITTAKLEDGSYLISVENPESSGRNTKNTMRLSEESYIGLVSNAFLYFSAKGESMEELMKESIDKKNEIEYSFSDNLLPVKSKK